MPPFHDLTGQTFGLLTVETYAGKRKWVCRCECQSSTTVRADHLRRGATLSCGCLKAHHVDLTGQTFGEWTLIERVESNAYGTPVYRCMCSCGTIRDHQSSNLVSGSTSSCGCVDHQDDHIGKTFGRLTVLIQLPRVDGKRLVWICSCSCGNHHRAEATNILAGRTTSCGCFQKEQAKKPNTSHFKKRHGLSRSKAYRAWVSMKQRCYNPRTMGYHRYGGRGIQVCEEWRNSFQAFYADLGDPPTSKHSLDRYPNRDGNYEKTNCRWATPTEQLRNTKQTRFADFHGIQLPLATIAELTGLSKYQIRYRLDRHIPFP